MRVLMRLVAGITVAVLFAVPAQSHAFDTGADPFAELSPISDVELAEQRGGLKTPLGEIDFGAVVRTFVDGQMALESELDWTEAGAVQTQALGVLQHELNQRGGTITAARDGATPSLVIGHASGGSTTILHELANDQIANVVINTASNRDIRLETDITLVIPELSKLQEDLIGQQLELGLHDAIGQALVSAGL